MALSVRKLHPLFGAEVAGFDMRHDTDDGSVNALKAVLDEFAFCVVPHDAPLTDEEHIRFSGLMGPMERGRVPNMKGNGVRVPYDEIVDQSNLDGDGTMFAPDSRRLMYKRANRLWHTDMSFHDVRATWSLLSAHVVPPHGGETELVDMRAVHDDLPDALKSRLDGLVAEHDYWYSRVLGGGPEPTETERATRAPARHPLVHEHPRSGRKALYIASHIRRIVGWPDDETRDFLAELVAIATRPHYVFAHPWTVGDVLVWDNLATMHRATPFDDQTFVRDMRRTTCRERMP